MTKINLLRSFLLGSALVFALTVLSSQSYAACDPSGPPQPGCACDADFMNQIYAKAFLESQRQILLHETVMRKPDSVFEYTCFDQEVEKVGDDAPPIFSESTRWSGVTLSNRPSIGGLFTPGLPSIGIVPVPITGISVYMGSGRLTADLNDIVVPALNQWISQNFSHNYLGGAITASITPGTGCDIMNKVWFYGKCEDFARDNISSFGHPWPTFRELVNTDPRLLPETCNDGTKIEDDMIDLSENLDHTYVNFDDDNPTYIDRFFPAGSPPGPPECSDGIPTGIIVKRYEKTVDMLGNVTTNATAAFEDKICPNPSCYYEDTAGKCLSEP